jgi:hypothetical protein
MRPSRPLHSPLHRLTRRGTGAVAAARRRGRAGRFRTPTTHTWFGVHPWWGLVPRGLDPGVVWTTPQGRARRPKRCGTCGHRGGSSSRSAPRRRRGAHLLARVGSVGDGEGRRRIERGGRSRREPASRRHECIRPPPRAVRHGKGPGGVPPATGTVNPATAGILRRGGERSGAGACVPAWLVYLSVYYIGKCR